MSRSFLLFGFILYSVFLSSLANASDIDLSAPMDKGGWKLIWSEEFDYTGFPDSTKWSYDTEGNVYRSEERRVGKERRSRWSPYH